jgi:hypothetical protein
LLIEFEVNSLVILHEGNRSCRIAKERGFRKAQKLAMQRRGFINVEIKALELIFLAF